MTILESLGASLPSLPSFPPFFFHYAICILCALYLVVIAVLKFKYYYWYHQPLTFRFSVWRFWAARRPNTFTSTMNPLRDVVSVDHAAVVYPFITNVNYDNVKVYSTAFSRSMPWDDIIQGIAELLNKNHKLVVNHGSTSAASASASATIPYIHHERLACILSNETHGLAAFVGVYRTRLPGGVAGEIHGVCILTPRIKIERDLTDRAAASAAARAAPLSTSIYVCDHLAWSRYDISDRESLELLETTEYIQKSREIAGEQTLYRYNQIPWFVIPFTTVYTYALSLERLLSPVGGGWAKGGHTSVIKVSSVNFALFYAFINECSRDFRCSILNEITHLQHLIQSGIYQVYMLLLNKTRVISVYIYGPSWAQASPESLEDASMKRRNTVHKKKTRGNRIERLHNYISQTSTAVVKYLPPVIPAKYDLSGKRVGISRTLGAAAATAATGTADVYDPSTEIPRLLASIRNKQHCDTRLFVDGFIESLKLRCTGPGPGTVLIDTIAHNYLIIDEIVRAMAGATPVLWSNKWYYVLYNAIIHRELPCKDLFMI